MNGGAGSNMDVKELQKERVSIFEDFYNNILPKRLPVSFMLPSLVIAELFQKDLIKFQFDPTELADVADKAADAVYSDTCPVGGVSVSSRLPAFYQLLESQSFVMAPSGVMQHPEVIGMMPEDYDALIADPYACIIEKVLPRQYKALGLDDPIQMAKAVHMAITSKANDAADMGPMIKKLVDERGYYPGPPRGSGGFTAAPYDFLADQLRSFSGISMDIRRDRNKVAEACEALYPLMFKMGLPSNPSPFGSVSTPLHMPTYMREKDFVEIWLPTYKRLLEQYAALGVRVSAFCEHDWMRYLDVLTELPAGTILRFEYGDPQQIKDKLGKKFYIGGLYPINLIKTGTKQQCIDKAKEILDIMMPGGGYLFGFDKGPMTLKDINIENYNAVAEFVRDYAVYPNAGESFGMPLNSEGFTFDEQAATLKSKWLFNWEEFQAKYPYTPDEAKDKFLALDDSIFRFYMNLVI
jgi:hypothetical protein